MKFVDFLKPRWKHSDPRIRTEAIREMEPEYHLEDLVCIATEDELLENQKLALKKISSAGALSRVAQAAREKSIKETAQQKLNEIWVKQVKTSNDLDTAFETLEKVSEPKYLEEICLSDTRLEVKNRCIEALSNPASFYKIAMKEAKQESAFKALVHIDKPVQLEALSKKAASKAVRAACAAKIQNIASNQETQSEEKVTRAKFELLCSTMESLQSPREWQQAYHEVSEAEAAWDMMIKQGHVADGELAHRFMSLKKAFWDSYNDHRQKEEVKLRRETELKANLTAKQELCDTFDQLMHNKQNPERDERISELLQKWDTLGNAGDEHEERLELYFQRLSGAFRRERDEQKKAREREEEIQSRQKSVEDRITEVFQKAEMILEVKDPEAGREKLQAVVKEWDELDKEADHPLIPQFVELQSRIRNTIDELAGKQLEDQRETLGKMRPLIPRMENLVDNPDLISAEKESRNIMNTWRELDRINISDEELLQEYEALNANFQEACDQFKEAQEWLRWANLKKKQDICEQLEKALAEDTESKELFTKMRELQNEWKSIGPMSWDSSKEVWDRYRKVTDDIYEKCKDLYSELEEERRENLKIKEQLCEQVENQKDSANWRESSDIIKEAQAKWKDIGPVPKEHSDTVWTRFQNACDSFFTARKAHFEELGKDKDENFRQKEKLCELVEAHKEDTSWKETAEVFKKAQEDWKAIGPVPREKMDDLWNRFRDACDYFFNRREEFFKHLEGEKSENLKKKEGLCEQVEKLDDIKSDSEKFNLIKKVQAEWKTIGPVDKNKAEPIWERFRKPIDAYFEDRKEKFEIEQKTREENLVKKEEICGQAIALADSRNWRETSEKLKALQAAWKGIGPAPRDRDRDVWTRFRNACDTFFSNMKDHYRQLDDQRELNLRTKEDLCFQAEVLAGFETTRENGESGEEAVIPVNDNWQEASRQIKELQKKWKQTGPVPKARSDELWFRFRKACDYVFDFIRGTEGGETIDLDANLKMKTEICEEAERISKQVHTDSQIQKIKELQKEWKQAGPVPVQEHTDLWERFKKACDLVFAEDERLRE